MTEQLVGQTLAGKYRIEQLLREDNFGKTFRATHVLMEKTVAVKILNPELATNAPVIADFQQEAKLLSRISHPHVLSVTDYGIEEQLGVPFLVMENFDGRTLKELIQTEGALPLQRAVAILTQVADAIAAAHENGLIHGALRSDSILIAGNGKTRDFVKVVDFDATNKTSNIDFYDRQTANGGTESVAYLSPEQCSDSAETDKRSDIYSLGIILYETLTARLPFVGSSTTEVMMKHAQEIPPSLLAVRHDLLPTFEQIVQRALAKNPAQRFQSAEEFSAALTTASEGAPLPVFQREPDTVVHARGDTAIASATDARWKTAFVVLAGISLMSVTLFYFTQNRRTTPGTDPNSSPVMPINPATGAPEQNLSPDFSNLQLNTNLDANFSTVPPGGGGGGFTGVPERIPPGIYQNYPPGYVDPNSNSPFMQDLNPVAPPSPTPKTSPKPSVSPTPAASPGTSPTPAAASPKPTTQPTTAPTPNTPAASPKPTAPPARNTPVPKPTQPSTEKSAQSLSDRISEQ